MSVLFLSSRDAVSTVMGWILPKSNSINTQTLPNKLLNCECFVQASVENMQKKQMLVRENQEILFLKKDGSNASAVFHDSD